jgi:hypothetical protein
VTGELKPIREEAFCLAIDVMYEHSKAVPEKVGTIVSECVVLMPLF